MGSLTYREEYLSKLMAYKDKDLIKMVTRRRRSRKSTLLELYRKLIKSNGVRTSHKEL